MTNQQIERRLIELRAERTRLAWGYESSDPERTAQIIEEMIELSIQGAKR